MKLSEVLQSKMKDPVGSGEYYWIDEKGNVVSKGDDLDRNGARIMAKRFNIPKEELTFKNIRGGGKYDPNAFLLKKGFSTLRSDRWGVTISYHTKQALLAAVKVVSQILNHYDINDPKWTASIYHEKDLESDDEGTPREYRLEQFKKKFKL